MEERPSIVNLLYSNNTITADDELDAAVAEADDRDTDDLESLITDHFQDEEYSRGNSTSQTDFNMMEGEHNRIFFSQQHNAEHGGIRGVAHRAAIHDRCCLDINDMVDEQDGKLLFEITDNLRGSIEAERRHFQAL